MKILSVQHEAVGKQIVDIAFKIHKALVPGLLEKVYESCFCYELAKRNLRFQKQQKVPIIYDNITFPKA